MSEHASSCIFCRLLADELPVSIVEEGDDVLAVMDIRPVNPGHVLVFPKVHAPGTELEPEAIALEAREHMEMRMKNLLPRGFTVSQEEIHALALNVACPPGGSRSHAHREHERPPAARRRPNTELDEAAEHLRRAMPA